MKLTLVASTVILATLSLPLHAGGGDSKELMITPTLRADSGMYVAVYGGTQFDTAYGNERRNVAVGGVNADVPFQTTNSGWGAAGGVKLGYNFDSYVINESLRLQPAVEGEALYLGTTSTGKAGAGGLNGALKENTS